MEGLSADGTSLSPGQVARMLGVSPKTVCRWARAGRISAAVAPSMGLGWGDAGGEGA